MAVRFTIRCVCAASIISFAVLPQPRMLLSHNSRARRLGWSARRGDRSKDLQAIGNAISMRSFSLNWLSLLNTRVPSFPAALLGPYAGRSFNNAFADVSRNQAQ
jgi:hypothetical protein